MCSGKKTQMFVKPGNSCGECVSNLVDLGMTHAKVPTEKGLLTLNNFRKLRNEINICSCLGVWGQ